MTILDVPSIHSVIQYTYLTSSSVSHPRSLLCKLRWAVFSASQVPTSTAAAITTTLQSANSYCCRRRQLDKLQLSAGLDAPQYGHLVWQQEAALSAEQDFQFLCPHVL